MYRWTDFPQNKRELLAFQVADYWESAVKKRISTHLLKTSPWWPFFIRAAEFCQLNNAEPQVLVWATCTWYRKALSKKVLMPNYLVSHNIYDIYQRGLETRHTEDDWLAVLGNDYKRAKAIVHSNEEFYISHHIADPQLPAHIFMLNMIDNFHELWLVTEDWWCENHAVSSRLHAIRAECVGHRRHARRAISKRLLGVQLDDYRSMSRLFLNSKAVTTNSGPVFKLVSQDLYGKKR